MCTYQNPSLFSVTALSLSKKQNFLAIRTRSSFSVISPLNDQCDHRLGLDQKLCKTSTITQLFFDEIVPSLTLVLSRKSGKMCRRQETGVALPLVSQRFLPSLTHSNRRDRALALTETSGFDHPRILKLLWK